LSKKNDGLAKARWKRRILVAAPLGLVLCFVVLLARSPTSARVPPRIIDLGGGSPRDARASCVSGLRGVCPAEVEDCQRRLFAVVQCLLRESSAKGPPPVRLVTGDEMRELTEAGRSERSRRLVSVRRWLSWLGLGTESPALDPPIPPQGHYSFATRTIYLSRALLEGSPRGGFYVLAHEMVHAIQDEIARLSARSPGIDGLDEELAQRAVLEGEAYFHEEHLRNLMEGRTTDAWRTAFADGPVQANRAALEASCRFASRRHSSKSPTASGSRRWHFGPVLRGAWRGGSRSTPAPSWKVRRLRLPRSTFLCQCAARWGRPPREARWVLGSPVSGSPARRETGSRRRRRHAPCARSPSRSARYPATGPRCSGT
jgi:hypothetical protein